MKFNCSIDKELQEYLENQYKEYISKTPMTKTEQRALREWVKSGHSVYENPGSRYLCESYPPQDYLEVYRQDHEIKLALEGKSPDEIELYLREYMGYEPAESVGIDSEPKKTAKEYIRELEHDLFFLWDYICSEGLWNKATKYLEEHKDEDIPFGYEE